MIRRFRFLWVLIPIAFVTAAAFATMGLWNWLMPALFGFGSLTFLKALGIFALARLFFGGRGWGGWRHRRYAWAGGHHGWYNNAEWQKRMQEKWQNMSPDQREKFKSRCGGWYNFDEAKTETKTEQQ
ncbi:MAG: hypothetical protein JWO03_3386 [Bacteroidetes bacterium]|nr:hypothetical protein [Bacteroidota bacterium]